MKNRSKKFIYLISPTKIIDKSFYYELNLVLKSNKISFFQLRLKNETIKRKIIIAKKIIKDKIIGITCHNSLKLAKNALLNKVSYIAIGAFYQTKTKKVEYRANIQTLKKIKKLVNLPIVAIGGINEKNYKKLLLNKADFLAISSYIWNNKKLRPHQAVKKLK